MGVERTGADAEKAPRDEEDEATGLADRYGWWRDLYLSFDRRTLGLTRILLGTFLLFDLFRRTPDWLWMFSDQGVLPASHNLARPQSSGWSLFNAFHSAGELWALWAIGFVIFGMLLVGYHTRVVQVLAAIYVASANGRVLLIENGGYVVQNLLLLWTAFLPLGDRFSVDALRKSWRRRERDETELNDWESRLTPTLRSPHVSLVGAAILLQLSALYFFNVVHKTGPAWSNNTAVHYVLYNDRMATPIVAAVRDHLPNVVVLFLSKLVMLLEAGIPLCLLSPLARVWSRRFVIFGIVVLHIGFGSSFVLGPFAWSLCVFASLYISKEDWELAGHALRRARRAITFEYHPADRLAFAVARLLKRLDGLRLVRFAADEAVESAVVVNAGRRYRAGEAVAPALRALPLGPLVATPFGWLSAHLPARMWRVMMSAVRPLAMRSAAEASALKPTPLPEEDFVSRWLVRDERRPSVSLTIFGAVLAVYGGPLLDRAQPKLSQTVVVSLTLGDICFGVGIALALAGAALLLLSLWRTAAERAGEGTRDRGLLLTLAREVLVVVMLAGALNQALVELWVAKPLKFPQPAVMQLLAHKLRYLQGWFMFSPNPVMDDGTIVVDAVTVDGRHVDPFSIHYGNGQLRPPNFDLLNAQSLEYNQIWSDYFNRMHYPANRAHRKPMEEFIYRLPQRTGNPQDAIVSGDVYWVHDMNPRWNTTVSYDEQREKLFSFTNPSRMVQKVAQRQGGAALKLPAAAAKGQRGPKKSNDHALPRFRMDRLPASNLKMP